MAARNNLYETPLLPPGKNAASFNLWLVKFEGFLGCSTHPDLFRLFKKRFPSIVVPDLLEETADAALRAANMTERRAVIDNNTQLDTAEAQLFCVVQRCVEHNADARAVLVTLGDDQKTGSRAIAALKMEFQRSDGESRALELRNLTGFKIADGDSAAVIEANMTLVTRRLAAAGAPQAEDTVLHTLLMALSNSRD
ncbi:unnamed protein product, partial [Phaeothamnion confervicola]